VGSQKDETKDKTTQQKPQIINTSIADQLIFDEQERES
jgi:hypothetical protein